AVHAQAPATQSWPVGQGAPPPQRQAPAVQRSDLAASQLVQAPPADPHALTDGVLQVEPVQQPAQVWAQPAQAPPAAFWPPRQAPLKQRSAVVTSQVMQEAPWRPHALVDDGVHTSPRQQPVGQLAVSHTQRPPRHSWPLVQAGPLPQAQAPPEQSSA